MRVAAVIPARYESTRFPGKPLALIHSKPMIQWVYERTMKAELVDQVIVATDDRRIEKAVQQFGGQVKMTPNTCASGSDRVAVVAADLSADVIVNVQGDEPLIDPRAVDLVIRTLLSDEQAEMATLVRNVRNVQELTNPNTVRVIFDRNQRALYFSRAAIPYARDVNDLDQWIEKYTFYLHIGIYAYRRPFLLSYQDLPTSRLEGIEKLEQLRALENGHVIKIGVGNFDPICVDVPKDIERVEKELKK